jgi:hypothetical protein
MRRGIGSGLLLVTLGTVATGCLEADAPEAAPLGQVSVPLVATGSSGQRYAINFAFFRANGPADSQLLFGGNGDGPSVTTELPVGDYAVTLDDGWWITRDAPGDQALAVEATLLSANPQLVHVSKDSVTSVRLRFHVENQVVVETGGEGNLEIGIDIDDGTAPDAGP